MNLLLAVLGKAIFDGNNKCPQGMNAKHWRFNVRLAKAQLKKRKLSKDQWDLGTIYDTIIPRLRINGRVRQAVCKRCHTPVLFGFLLDGHKVTRRKVFCCDACKMKSARCH